MSAAILKEFLITLGFKTNAGQERNFNNGVVAITAVVDKLAGSAVAAAEAVTHFAINTATHLEDLYWSSQRTGASAREIKAFEYAIEQMGGTAEGAKSSLEGLARQLRTQPGTQSIVDLLTGKAEEGKGAGQMIFDIATAVEKLRAEGKYWEAHQFAQMLGIDEDTLLAMSRGIAKFGDDYEAFAKAYGLYTEEDTKKGLDWMRSIRQLGAEWSAFADKIGTDVLPIFDDIIGAIRLALTLIFALDRALSGTSDFMTGDRKAGATAFKDAWTAIKSTFPKEWTGGPGNPFDTAVDRARPKGPGPGSAAQLPAPSRSAATQAPKTPAPATGRPGAPEALPLGLRMNNPGNLQPGGREASYPTMQAGLEAMAGLLIDYGRRGRDTIRGIVSAYAPEYVNGKRTNDTQAYILDIAKGMQAAADQRLNMRDPAVIAGLERLMINHEQGQQPFSKSQIDAAVRAKLGVPNAGSIQNITLNQKTEISVHGDNAKDIGETVAAAQDRVNGDLVRNLGAGRVR
jgi:hypothetical protein